MNLYNKYLLNKKKYNEYVILIESGIFIEVFDRDAIIINKLLDYKLISNNNRLRLGFPSRIINKVTIELNINHINYIVIDSNNNVKIKKKYKDNNYNKYIKEYKSLYEIDNRINIIYNRLNSKRKDNNINNILSKIEEVLN